MKKELRKKYINIRDSISEKDINNKSRIIQEKILKSDYINSYDNFLIYINIKSEVQTDYLIQQLISLNKNVYTPKIIDEEMTFIKITSTEHLTLGKYGILEAIEGEKYNKEKAIVIVPGVVFSKDKFRIGYGKGYYDRFIFENRKNYYIGICFEKQIAEKIEIEKWDERLDNIITENTVI